MTTKTKKSVNVIEIPRKVCLPKIKSQFKPDAELTDVDEDNFIFRQYGNAVFRATPWTPGERTDVIMFDSARFDKEFQKVSIGSTVDTDTAAKIRTIVKNFWDIFVAEGIRRPMLGFEFSIDTGSHTPVCCRKPHYGTHESKVIMDTVRTLRANDFIEECMTGGWGSPIVLAPKPHQENVKEIEDLIWRMCVSYRSLNKVTNPFEFPIGRCDAAIEDVGDGSGKIYFISLDAAQGYHQIKVRHADKHKLAFFAPDNKKYTYKVMPFGPRNAPTYYIAITRIIQDEATKLFRYISTQQKVDLHPDTSMQPESAIENLPRTDSYSDSCLRMMLPNLALDPEYTTSVSTENPINDPNVHVVPTEGGECTVRQRMASSDQTHTTGSAVIIDDLLLRSTSKSLLLLLLECFCRVYLKYRVTLKISKCDFMQEKFEFVGHDVLSTGNTAASSKYDRISSWKLPTSSDGLHSFVALCNFYNRFLPLFEMKVAPLRNLYMRYLHKAIPSNEWTPERKTLFESLKKDLTSAPILARYDSTKPVVLKTDWRSLGFSFILMQPADDPTSQKASVKLCAGEGCDFDLSMEGPRLQPFHCGMRACRGTEEHYHSFVGESAALRWAIAKNKSYLWGSRFYCLCDMKSLDKLLEYDGPIHCLRRWAQDLQSYDFTPYHRPAQMMRDVDALNRGPYATVLTTYMLGTKTIKVFDKKENSDAYKEEIFSDVMSKGKYNLKSINAYKVTNDYIEKASRLLTRIYDAQRKGNNDIRIVTNAPVATKTKYDQNENDNTNANAHDITNTTSSHSHLLIGQSIWEASPPPEARATAHVSIMKTTAHDDLVRTFLHLSPSCSVNAIRASGANTKEMKDSKRNSSHPVISRVKLSSYKPHVSEQTPTRHLTDKSAVDNYLETHMFKWLFVGEGIPTITYNLNEALCNAIDVTILSTNLYQLELCQSLLPSATRILSSIKDLMKIVEIDEYRETKHHFRLHDIQNGCAHLPIAQPTFKLDGIELNVFDITQKHHANNSNTLTLSQAAEMIRLLHQKRDLSTFIITCRITNTESTDTAARIVNAADIMHYLPDWEIMSSQTHTAAFGDPIADTIVILKGCHNSKCTQPFQTISAPPTSTFHRNVHLIDHLQHQDDPKPLFFQYMMYEKVSNGNNIYDDHEPHLIGKAYPAPPGEPLFIYDPHHPCPAITPLTSNIGTTIFMPNDPILRVRKIFSGERAALYFHNAPKDFCEQIQHLCLSQATTIQSITSKSIPWHTAQAHADYFIDNALQFMFQSHPSTLSNITRIHVITKVPDEHIWKEAYANDQDINYIISRLLKTKTPWDENKEIRRVDKGYWQHLRDNRFTFEHGRLVLFHLIGSTHRYLSLIVVPMDLRKTIFHAYHSSGSGAHMAFHKTFLAIRMRFFWPKMRANIQAWCKGCEQCIRSRARRKESTGLVHSWPITSPFAIISVDIWKPGDTTNIDGFKMLLNAMCDMTQFIVSTPIKTSESTFLARTFMEHVLLKFGLCVMVVCDAGSEFRGHFQAMCETLNLRFHLVAKRNHKAVGVERFHKFLNHAQKIGTEERGTSAAFVEIGMTTAYAWNASCIDGTEIVRSIPAIGRPLKYPLDINLCTTPPIIDNPSNSVAQYLRYVDRDKEFSQRLLQWLIDDRRAQHRERVNENRHLITYEAGDIVMGRIAVQSNSSKGVVGKLVFQTRGPFVVLEKTQGSSYMVRQYGIDDGPKQKFQTEDLYLLPKEILPCEHLDLPDMKYMNFDYAPINHPFGKAFDIAGYNNAWYNDKPPSKPQSYYQKR